MALAALHDVRSFVAGSATKLLTLPIPAGLLPFPSPKERDLAAAAACHQVLRLRYPNQAFLLETAWCHWLDAFEMGPAGTSVEMAGRAYGSAVHRFGRDDMDRAPATRPSQAFPGGVWGNATPLAAARVMDFPPPPGRLDAGSVIATRQYRDDVRSLAEEVIGSAWANDGPQEIGTPPRLYLQVVLKVLDSIEERHPGRLQELEALAVVAGAAVAMADAGIDAWYYKYAPTHRMGRRTVAIPGAVVGNGVADASGLPLRRPVSNGTGAGLTPDVPSYPCGPATMGAAAFQLLRLFLVDRGVASFDPAGSGRDDVRFDFVSDAFDGRHRHARTQRPRHPLTLSYASLWEAMVDNSVSRVYLGVHWEFDGITSRLPDTDQDVVGVPATPRELGRTGGVWLGAKVANQIAQKLNIPITTIAASGIL